MDAKLRRTVDRNMNFDNKGNRVRMKKRKINNLKGSKEMKKLIVEKSKVRREILYML